MRDTGQASLTAPGPSASRIAIFVSGVLGVLGVLTAVKAIQPVPIVVDVAPPTAPNDGPTATPVPTTRLPPPTPIRVVTSPVCTIPVDGGRAEVLPASKCIDVRVVFDVGSANDPDGKRGLTDLAASAAYHRQRAVLSEAMRAAQESGAATDLLVTGEGQTRFRILAPVELAEDLLASVGGLRVGLVCDEGDVATILAEAARDQAQHDRFEARSFAREALRFSSWHPGDAPTREDLRLFPTVQGITPATVCEHMRSFNRDRLTVGVRGEVPPNFVDRLQDIFATLPTSTTPWPAAPTETGNRAVVVTTNEVEAGMSQVAVGFLLPPGDDTAALEVARLVLGGGGGDTSPEMIGGRLHGLSGISEDHAVDLAPSLTSSERTRDSEVLGETDRLFRISIGSARDEKVALGIETILTALRDLTTKGITDAELRAIQANVAKRSQPGAEAPFIEDDLLADDVVWARIATVTVADVNAAIARNLRADRVQISVVSRNAAIAPVLARRGIVDAENIRVVAVDR